VPNPQPANPLQAGLPGISATGITPLPATEAEPASETTASVASDQETASTRNLLEMIRNTLAQADRPVMAGVAQGAEQGKDGKDSTQAMNLVPGLSIQPQDSLPVNDPQLRVQLAAAIKDQVRILSQHSSSGAHDFSNQPGNENLQHQQATHTQGNVERGQFVLQTRPADTYMLQTGVQKQEWAGELGNRVTMMAKDGLELAHLRLNPANLGTLEVRISVQNDQTQVHFLSQHAHVRDALEASLPRLREMMHDGGLSLGDVNISDQSPAREQDNSGRGFQRNSNLFSAALPDTEVLPQIMDMKVHNPRGVDFYA
jgi:flagellar hook-length control protein FliK